MSEKERESELFIKGMQCYQDKNYQEALKYFLACAKINSNDTTTLYIESCKKRLMNSQSQSQNGSSTKSNYSNGNSNGSTTYLSEEVECEKIINNKNYYDLLKVTKKSSIQEIKKAYKKLAIKFHPDKNKCSKSEEAFKKIATAYQTLSDPEKKTMFDKYGTEEEYREKYYQAHQQQYEEDIDPYDLLNKFFSGQFNARYSNRTPRGQETYYENNDNQRPNQQNVRLLGLIQILPIILIFGGYILSSLFQTVPLYQFHKNYNYQIKKKTTLNKIDYFVNSEFTDKYPTVKSIKESKIELQIERDYLNFIQEECQDVMKYKRELEAQLSYYRYNQYYRNQIYNKIQHIKYDSCYKYQDLAKIIR